MAWFFQTEYKDYDEGTYYSPDMSPIPKEQERFKEMGAALAKEIEAKWMVNGRDMDSPWFPFAVPGTQY